MHASSAETLLALVSVNLSPLQKSVSQRNPMFKILSQLKQNDPRYQTDLVSKCRRLILRRLCATLLDDLTLVTKVLMLWNEGEALTEAMNSLVLREVEKMPTLRGVSWSSDPFFTLTSDSVTLDF